MIIFYAGFGAKKDAIDANSPARHASSFLPIIEAGLSGGIASKIPLQIDEAALEGVDCVAYARFRMGKSFTYREAIEEYLSLLEEISPHQSPESEGEGND